MRLFSHETKRSESRDALVDFLAAFSLRLELFFRQEPDGLTGLRVPLLGDFAVPGGKVFVARTAFPVFLLTSRIGVPKLAARFRNSFTSSLP
jgi:hypothetical protein